MLFRSGVAVDESSLSSLAKAGLELVKGATGMAGAVQDQVPTEARVPVFDGMPNIVTGRADITESVSQVLNILGQ